MLVKKVRNTLKASDFEYIYNADGTCGARWDCGKPGVVLAYDDFSPEVALWFCEECWQAESDCEFSFVNIVVEDRRRKELAKG